MARVQVYVTDEMKARMDALRDRVNWSELAQAAFERGIAAAEMPEDPNIDQVIERLRASKAASWEINLKHARERGREWARKRASYDKLKTVSRLRLTEQGTYAHQFDRLTFEEDSGDMGGYFYEICLPNNDPMPPDDYVEAFVEGVKDVWAQVGDKI